MQVAADEGITSIGSVERRRYRHIQNTALKLLLSITYIEGEASEQGVVVTERQVSAKMMAIKQANFQSEREYRQFLRERRLTAQEARQRVRAQLLDERVIERVLKDASGTAAQEDTLREFVKGFRIRWWGRTSCTKAFDIAPCAAGLAESATGPTATFESDEFGNSKGAGPGNASDG